MKKWSAILAITAFAIFAVADVIHDFLTNDPIGYFSAKPQELLYVAGVALTGGLGVLGFYRLPLHAQHVVKTLSWGGGALTITTVVGYLASLLMSLFTFIRTSSGTISILWILVALLMLTGIAAYFWWEFLRAWRAGVSR